MGLTFHRAAARGRGGSPRAEEVAVEGELLYPRQPIRVQDHAQRRHVVGGEAFAVPFQLSRLTHLCAAHAKLAAQRDRPRATLLQHLERRPQRRPQPEARAAERDGDDGLERVGEAVDDHAQLVVAQRAERARRHRLSEARLAASRACRARRHRRQTRCMHSVQVRALIIFRTAKRSGVRAYFARRPVPFPYFARSAKRFFCDMCDEAYHHKCIGWDPAAQTEPDKWYCKEFGKNCQKVINTWGLMPTSRIYKGKFHVMGEQPVKESFVLKFKYLLNETTPKDDEPCIKAKVFGYGANTFGKFIIKGELEVYNNFKAPNLASFLQFHHSSGTERYFFKLCVIKSYISDDKVGAIEKQWEKIAFDFAKE